MSTAADKPDPSRFAKFVSSVRGRVVSRMDTGEFIGARRLQTTKAERQSGVASIEWEEERVVPLTHEYYTRFRRETDRAIKHGDLKERSAEDWLVWLKRQQEHAEAEAADLKKAAEEAKKKAEAEAKAKADAEKAAGKKDSEGKRES